METLRNVMFRTEYSVGYDTHLLEMIVRYRFINRAEIPMGKF